MLYSLSSNVLHLQSACVHSSRPGAVFVLDFQKPLEKVCYLAWTSCRDGFVLFNAAEANPYFRVDLNMAMQQALRTSQGPRLNKSLLSHLRAGG